MAQSFIRKYLLGESLGHTANAGPALPRAGKRLRAGKPTWWFWALDSGTKVRRDCYCIMWGMLGLVLDALSESEMTFFWFSTSAKIIISIRKKLVFKKKKLFVPFFLPSYSCCLWHLSKSLNLIPLHYCELCPSFVYFLTLFLFPLK